MKTNGTIGMVRRKWENRKIEQQANEIQKEASNNDMKPHMGLSKRQKTTSNHKKTHHCTKKTEQKHMATSIP